MRRYINKNASKDKLNLYPDLLTLNNNILHLVILSKTMAEKNFQLHTVTQTFKAVKHGNDERDISDSLPTL